MRRLDLNAQERRFRSRIAQLAGRDRLIRGSLNPRFQKCGKPNCHCAQGEPHQVLYLVQSQGGKKRQIFVPKTWEARVRQAVADYQEMQRLIEEVSQLEWGRLERRET